MLFVLNHSSYPPKPSDLRFHNWSASGPLSTPWFIFTDLTCSPPGSSVWGISQARILEWVTMPSSRGSSWPRDQTCVSASAGRLFTTEPTGKPILTSASNNFEFWSPLYLERRERPGIHPDQPGEKYSVCTQMSCILGLDYAEQGAPRERWGSVLAQWAQLSTWTRDSEQNCGLRAHPHQWLPLVPHCPSWRRRTTKLVEQLSSPLLCLAELAQQSLPLLEYSTHSPSVTFQWGKVQNLIPRANKMRISGAHTCFLKVQFCPPQVLLHSTLTKAVHFSFHGAGVALSPWERTGRPTFVKHGFNISTTLIITLSYFFFYSKSLRSALWSPRIHITRSLVLIKTTSASVMNSSSPPR